MSPSVFTTAMTALAQLRTSLVWSIQPLMRTRFPKSDEVLVNGAVNVAADASPGAKALGRDL